MINNSVDLLIKLALANASSASGLFIVRNNLADVPLADLIEVKDELLPSFDAAIGATERLLTAMYATQARVNARLSKGLTTPQG